MFFPPFNASFRQRTGRIDAVSGLGGRHSIEHDRRLGAAEYNPVGAGRY
jgi:hypothetical protein